MASNWKTCLITGCSEGGVGAALAQAFIDKGYHVYATARTTSKIPASLHDAANVTILTLDVSSSASIAAAAEAVEKDTGGSLDVLINNAGAGMIMPTLDSSIAESKKLFDLNFFSVLETIQVFIPLLVKAKGCIVNNASVGGYRPLVFNGTPIVLPTTSPLTLTSPQQSTAQPKPPSSRLAKPYAWKSLPLASASSLSSLVASQPNSSAISSPWCCRRTRTIIPSRTSSRSSRRRSHLR